MNTGQHFYYLNDIGNLNYSPQKLTNFNVFFVKKR